MSLPAWAAPKIFILKPVLRVLACLHSPVLAVVKALLSMKALEYTLSPVSSNLFIGVGVRFFARWDQDFYLTKPRRE